MRVEFSVPPNWLKSVAKYFILSSCFLFPSIINAQTILNENSIGKPNQSSTSNEFLGSVSPFIRATPKNLSAQKLNPSSYPDEAELYCGTNDCIFGLSHGLVVGGKAVGMFFAPLRKYFDSNWVSGGVLSFVDIFGGFQVLRDTSKNIFMNVQLGYRRISFDDGTNSIATHGLTTEVHYSQLITPIYLQGIEFAGYLTFGDAALNNTSSLNINSSGHDKLNTSAGYFYRISQTYPTYRVALPADLELINWDTAQTGLVMPIHGYFEFAPFYIQNNLSFRDNNISLAKTEQNFGLRLAGVASYESMADKSKTGRYALKSALGLDIATSNFTTTRSGNSDLDLPKRSFVAPYFEFAGSWQF